VPETPRVPQEARERRARTIIVESAIRSRRSIRGLLGPPLPPEDVEALVALAVTAPAPHHTQPWRFAEVSPGRRDALATAMGEAWRADLVADGVPEAQRERALARSRRQIEEAPTLLLGCAVAEGLRVYADDRRARAEWTLATHSFGAAMQNILLAASTRGLGAFWISAPLYAQDAVRAALDLDLAWQPQALIALGHPSADYRPFDRPTPDLAKHFVRC
jgi:coenzyme F420-0:L-glutamate ligase / coenzyme F420-1:gamma-L-glutamate ligase